MSKLFLVPLVSDFYESNYIFIYVFASDTKSISHYFEEHKGQKCLQTTLHRLGVHAADAEEERSMHHDTRQ